MRAAATITTSWDDGHPLDFRVAELLAKHGLRGSFYVPRTAPTGTMTAAQVRELSGSFELGAHTVHHVDLTRVTPENARQEIVDAKAWLEDSTGRPCSMFCPPLGRYSVRHLEMIRQAGFGGLRSVELLSLDRPRLQGGLRVLPTTLQAHPHGFAVYARNVIKRRAWRNLWLYVCHGRSRDWPTLVRSLLRQTLQRGGVFHLWGHSWELEATGQWQRLEEVLGFLRQWTHQATALSNGQVCGLIPSRDEAPELDTSVVRCP
ncbi:MAG TPA: polysaccharide deacetylase family protein [Gemmataceae bacterium]|nr:polysaccharide deacetylase family protein [Gemmataceae bacterium]